MRCFFAVVLVAVAASGAPSWVAKSNEHSKVLLNVLAEFSPETAGSYGIEGMDERISDLSPESNVRIRAAVTEAREELRRRRAAEKDPLVAQDLDILIDASTDSLRTFDLNEKRRVPYSFVTRLVFAGIRELLDDQVAAARRPAALVRLRKYAGLEPGFKPIAEVAEARTRAKLADSSLLMPSHLELENHLATSAAMADGLGKLFEKYKVAGYQEPLATLRKQLDAYNRFVRTDLLPKARADFRLPADLYQDAARGFGVDIAPLDLIHIARASFTELQSQLEALAAAVAKEKNWPSSNYRDVLRRLKQEQIYGDNIVEHYRSRLAEIERILRDNKLAALPDRPARIRIASEAESAMQPAPSMRPPPLLNNTGQSGEFVLPLNKPGAGAAKRMDDFTFAAASWTLTAHELRPGHEMQFDAMVEHGVSTARAIFAFNSTNAEGWGLYSEYIVFPFMPAEGRLVSLQHRMLRAARAFLDPELHLGRVTREEALRVLKEDVVLSDAMAEQEIERYTFRAPAQATSYFYGFTRLLELRQELERTMGQKFVPAAFHDFVLSQGLLPHKLLRQVTLSHFAGPEPERIALRPDLPGSHEEFIGPNDTERRIRKVTSPVMLAYVPEKPNGTAVVIAPGGGFQHLAIDKEGTDVARWLNTLGITAFVLQYRVTLPDRALGQRAAVTDGILALRSVRRDAAKWGINPAKLGIIGFSAGGYVAAATATSSEPDARPAFTAPIYPAAPTEMVLGKGAPPIFIALANDDRLDPVENGVRLYTAWKKAGAPAELHIFSKGGHGFGMRKSGAPTDHWTEHFERWLRSLSLIP